jgi:hypothetical protein
MLTTDLGVRVRLLPDAPIFSKGYVNQSALFWAHRLCADPTREFLPLLQLDVRGHLLGPMAGSPLKRARKQGIRLDDGSVVAFPCMLRVAELPRGWAPLVTGREDRASSV